MADSVEWPVTLSKCTMLCRRRSYSEQELALITESGAWQTFANARGDESACERPSLGMLYHLMAGRSILPMCRESM